MRKLIIVILILSSSGASATDSKCDKVIEAQDKLIGIMGKRNEDLFQQVMDMQVDLSKSQQEVEKQKHNGWIWAALGVTAGVLAAGLVHK